MPRLVLLLVAVLCCVAPPALAGTNVRGTLWMSSSARARAAKAGAPRPQPGVREGVVWVEAIPGGLESRLAMPRRHWYSPTASRPPLPVVSQRGDRFSPRVLVVPAGSNVVFANRDGLYHGAFSVSSAKAFDLGKRAPGRRDTVGFERAGVVNLHCEIHPLAIGYVVVTPNHAYAVPDSTGCFRLPRLPEGRYVLHAWHPRLGDRTLAFAVPRRGAVALEPSF